MKKEEGEEEANGNKGVLQRGEHGSQREAGIDLSQSQTLWDERI